MTEHEWAITVSRQLDASTERVWRAFQSENEFKVWYAWQGDDFTIDVESFDLNVGGRIEFTSSFEGELAYRVAWRITDVVEYERLAYINDLWVRREDGTVSDEAVSSRVQITLKPQGSGTEISWAETGASEQARQVSQQAEEIATHHLERLAMHVSSATG